jgi:molecular chaperone DnaK
MADKIFGIDLGTSSSCIAVADGANVRVLPSRQGYPLTPSLVAVNLQHRLLVGTLAKRQAVTNPSGTVSAFKRLIGRAFNAPEVSQIRARVPYHIVSGPGNEVLLSLHGQVMSPVEVGGYVLRELAESASRSLGEPVRKVIITVPANYNEVQRQSTVRAAQLAGLEVVRLLNEPTAAALAYGATHPGKRRNIAIYDLGGGTFDVTILAVEQDIYEVLATHGNTFLGGEDFDSLIIQRWLQDLERNHGIDLKNDRMALARIKEAAETVKIALSSAPQAEIDLPFLSDRPQGPLHYTGKLTRQEFEQMAMPLIKGTLDTCNEALRLAGVPMRNIDDVILIGGMTRMPAVQSMVKEFFQRNPARGIHPEEAVAAGAALHGASLLSGGKGQLLLDVIPQTLSVVAAGRVTPVIQRGARLPAKQARTFATSQDNQRSVKVRVVQGEHTEADKNVLVGVFEVGDLPPMPRGEVKISVEFQVNTDGLLEVTATDEVTGKRREVRVSEALRNSEAQILTLSAATMT